MNTKQTIYSHIHKAILEHRGLCAVIAYEYIIKEQLDKFNPAIPADGTINYIAYDIAGKPKNMSTNETMFYSVILAPKRKKLKTNRFLVRKLCLKEKKILPDSIIQKLASDINEKLFPDTHTEIRIDIGQQITANYANGIGGGSCMSGCNSQSTKMYENNPDVYGQLIMLAGNDSSRAMLVKLDNDVIFMDRVYSTCDFLFGKMTKYAQEQNYAYRQYSGAEDTSVIFSGDEDYNILVISNVKYCDGEVPFADTLLNYTVIGENRLKISHANTGLNFDGTLDSTSGYLGSGYFTCHSCDYGEIEEGEELQHGGEIYCESCYSEIFSCCEHCNETVHTDEIYQVRDTHNRESYVCEYCRDNNYSQCENCEECFADTVEHESSNYCNSCFEDLFAFCDVCEEHAEIDSVQFHDNLGMTVCGDCFNDKYNKCVECDNTHEEENMVEHEEDYYCNDCFVEKKSLLKDVV